MNIVYLQNLEQIYKYCILDRDTHSVQFIKTDKKIDGFYYKKEELFFALYPTKKGPMIFYLGKEYVITPELIIDLHEDGKNRTFKIKDYNIEIEYLKSPYIGMDVWSDEIDVDLFYMIAKKYKDKDFCQKYTDK